MVRVKSKSQIQANYEQSTTIVRSRYEAGVGTAEWKQNALDGQALYEAQMSDPNVLARRNQGIDRVSDSQWRTDTVKKGAPVIAQRMKDAGGKQANNFEPYRQALESLTLPDRTGDPMENLINRAGAVVKRMVNTKHPNTYTE